MRKPISVIHVTHFDPPIHGEAMMASQLRELAAAWPDIRYHSINAVFTRERDQLGRPSGKKLFLLFRYLFATLAAKFLYRADTLIIHPAFHPTPFLKESAFVWLGWLLRMKVIAWIHMDPVRIDYQMRPRWFRAWLHFTLRRIHLFVACAPALPTNWPEWLKSRPHVGIANSIPDPLHGRCPASPGSREGAPLRVAYLSAIDPDKGWRELFEAAQAICARREGVEFDFYGGIGSNEDEAEIRSLFSTSGQASRVRWHGACWGHEKIERLCGADLFVFPSHTEQFPLTILEAMACGLPIIATDVGAISNALSVPQGGMLIAPRSSTALEQAIDSFLDQPERLAAMGAHNRNNFVKEFSLGRFGESWRELLSSCSPTES